MAAVTPLSEDRVTPDLQQLYSELRDNFGIVPNFFALMARRPGSLKAVLPFLSEVLDEGTVEPRLKELAYVKTSMVNGCQYCTQAHTAAAKRAGVTDQQIQEILFYDRSQAFDDKEKATLLFAEQVTRGAATIRPPTLELLGKFFTEDEIVELTLVIAVANLTNRFSDALQIPPDLS
jgi:uncharacterized peroxidase-related enzyme